MSVRHNFLLTNMGKQKKKQKMDIIQSFYTGNKELDIPLNLFDHICGTDFSVRFPDHEEPIDVTFVVMYAYPKLDAVFRDVLMYVDDATYKPVTFKVIETEVKKLCNVERLIDPGHVHQPKVSFELDGKSCTASYSKYQGWMIRLIKE